MYLRLSCAVQNYVWGKVGCESEVALLKRGGDHVGPSQFCIDDQEHYAELWMGTHKKGPALIAHPQAVSGQLLSDWLKFNPSALGQDVLTKFDGQLPFLLKVLSINKALSIQAHPTKSHAQQLHTSAPDKYPDPNHKPELAIAVSEFIGFCGFRPFVEIQRFVSRVPELQSVVGKESFKLLASFPEGGNEEGKKSALKALFTGLMGCDAVTVKEELSRLMSRLDSPRNSEDIPAREKELLHRLNSQFPNDIGCFCVFFLNFIRLQPGEAIYLAPNEPHAYLFGDIVECMACSDNVVRAGLTIKFRDKDTLCKMLTYEMRSVEENKFHPHRHPILPNTLVYDPPTPEFAVLRITIPNGSNELTLPSLSGPSILIVVSGRMEASCNRVREEVTKGSCIFLPAGSILKLEPKLAEDMLVFQAYCSLSGAS